VARHLTFRKEGKSMKKLLTPLFVAMLLVWSPTATLAGELPVGELVTIFKGLSAGEIYEAVVAAKDKLAEDATATKRAEHEALFDSQIATLKDKGVPVQIMRMLSNQRDDVLRNASEATIGEGNIAFLPVIPTTYLSFYTQMAMVVHDGKEGYNYLQPNLILDKVETPGEPYWIYDVEDGDAMRGKSSNEAEKLLEDTGRSPLTVVEVVSLAIHNTNVLTRHFIDATGSRYESADKMSGVYLDYGYRPRLNWYYVGYSLGHWGSASCGSRG
jgi:hypothetical protein